MACDADSINTLTNHVKSFNYSKLQELIHVNFKYNQARDGQRAGLAIKVRAMRAHTRTMPLLTICFLLCHVVSNFFYLVATQHNCRALACYAVSRA